MVSLEQIKNFGIIIGILSGIVVIITFIKPYLNIGVVDLGIIIIILLGLLVIIKKREWLITKSKQLIEFVRELPHLWDISIENSRDYEKMIDFDPCHKRCYPYIRASESTLSPHIEFYFYITNRSIFDFKIEKISMNILDQDNNYIDKIDEAKEIDLPHQQVIQSSFIRPLHQNFVEKLKSLKKECESQWIKLEDVKIYLKDKKSPISCGVFKLKIHPMDI